MTTDEIAYTARDIERTIEAIENLGGTLRGTTSTLFVGEDGLKKRDELQHFRSEIYIRFVNYCKDKDIWKYYVESKNKSVLDFIKDSFHCDSYGKYTNAYGDEYTYDPFTGLLIQTSWGV